jgi:hypothetical protein
VRPTTHENVLSLDCAVCRLCSSCFSVHKLPVCPTHIFICLACFSLGLYRLLARGGNLSDSQWPRMLWHYTYVQWLLNVDRADPRLRVLFQPVSRRSVVYGAICERLLIWPVLAACFSTFDSCAFNCGARGYKHTDTWNGSFFFRSDVGIRITTWDEKAYAYSPYRLQTKEIAL